jgi:hypothetical protein
MWAGPRNCQRLFPATVHQIQTMAAVARLTIAADVFVAAVDHGPRSTGLLARTGPRKLEHAKVTACEPFSQRWPLTLVLPQVMPKSFLV